MRKALRGIFLGSAIAITASQGLAQQLPPPPGAARPPTPPTEEQQEQYEILRQYLQQQTAPAEPELRALEQLEDRFYGGGIDTDSYHEQRAAILRALYPELAETHIEYGDSQMAVRACAADNRMYEVPVHVMIEREDLTTLYNENSTPGNWQPGATRNYVTGLADFSNRIRNELEDVGRAALQGIDVHDEAMADRLQTALSDAAADISRIENIDIELRGNAVQALNEDCTIPAPATETEGPEELESTPAPTMPQPSGPS